MGQVTWPTPPKVLSVQNGLNKSDPFMSDNNRISLVDQVSFAHFDHICLKQIGLNQPGPITNSAVCPSDFIEQKCDELRDLVPNA